MRIAKLLFWLWLVGFLLIQARGGESFNFLEALPFVRRSHSVSPDYEWLAVALLLLLAWGYLRLAKRR